MKKIKPDLNIFYNTLKEYYALHKGGGGEFSTLQCQMDGSESVIKVTVADNKVVSL